MTDYFIVYNFKQWWVGACRGMGAIRINTVQTITKFGTSIGQHLLQLY